MGEYEPRLCLSWRNGFFLWFKNVGFLFLLRISGMSENVFFWMGGVDFLNLLMHSCGFGF